MIDQRPRKKHAWMYEDDIRLAKIRSAELGVPMSVYLRRVLREKEEAETKEKRTDARFRLY